MIRAKTICPAPGCNVITSGGRCERHKAKRFQGTTKNRSGDPFYSSADWIALRDWKRADTPLCEECESRGVLKAMAHVDHIKPRCDRPDLELDASNLQSLCESCHNRKTCIEQRSKRKEH